MSNPPAVRPAHDGVELDLTIDAGRLTLNLAAPPAWLNSLVVVLPCGQTFSHQFGDAPPGQPGCTPPLAELIRCFVDHLDLIEDREETTLVGYRRRLGQFARWLEANPDRPLAQAATWLAYYAHLKHRQPPYSPYTLKGHYHILNRFGRWLADCNYLPAPPLAEVQAPGLPSGQEPQAITAAHIGQMLRVARQPRDRALLLFFRDTGCRAAEATGLTWGQLDLANRRIEVLGKGARARKLFIKPVTCRALEAYRATLKRSGPADPVWWGKKGPLGYDGLYKVFKRLARRAGIGADVFNPHSWRHAFGRDTTIAGIPTAQLQDLMGHGSIEVTKVYARFNTTELQQAHDRYSPVDDPELIRPEDDLTRGENVVE